MKNVELDFISRLKLTGILSEVDGPLGKLTPLMSVFEKVRFTDEESKQIAVEQVGDRITYSTPIGQADFGKLYVDLEDSHATSLLNELEAWKHYKLADVVWVEKLKGQLK